MSDTYTEPIGDELDVAASYGHEGPTEPASDWRPTQDDWDQIRDTVGYLSEAIQADELAKLEARQADTDAELEDLLYEDPQAYVGALLEQRMAPINEYIAQREYEDALAAAEDLADDVMFEAGVPEAELDAVYDAATRLLEPMMQAYAQQYNHLYESVLANHGPEVAEQWVDEARRHIAVAALREAAARSQKPTLPVGDEHSLVEKYARMRSANTPRKAPVQTGDEHDLVAKYARGR